VFGCVSTSNQRAPVGRLSTNVRAKGEVVRDRSDPSTP
jgi:hypothetical protein